MSRPLKQKISILVFPIILLAPFHAALSFGGDAITSPENTQQSIQITGLDSLEEDSENVYGVMRAATSQSYYQKIPDLGQQPYEASLLSLIGPKTGAVQSGTIPYYPGETRSVTIYLNKLRKNTWYIAVFSEFMVEGKTQNISTAFVNGLNLESFLFNDPNGFSLPSSNYGGIYASKYVKISSPELAQDSTQSIRCKLQFRYTGMFYLFVGPTLFLVQSSRIQGQWAYIPQTIIHFMGQYLTEFRFYGHSLGIEGFEVSECTPVMDYKVEYYSALNTPSFSHQVTIGSAADYDNGIANCLLGIQGAGCLECTPPYNHYYDSGGAGSCYNTVAGKTLYSNILHYLPSPSNQFNHLIKEIEYDESTKVLTIDYINVFEADPSQITSFLFVYQDNQRFFYENAYYTRVFGEQTEIQIQELPLQQGPQSIQLNNVLNDQGNVAISIFHVFTPNIQVDYNIVAFKSEFRYDNWPYLRSYSMSNLQVTNINYPAKLYEKNLNAIHFFARENVNGAYFRFRVTDAQTIDFKFFINGILKEVQIQSSTFEFQENLVTFAPEANGIYNIRFEIFAEENSVASFLIMAVDGINEDQKLRIYTLPQERSLHTFEHIICPEGYFFYPHSIKQCQPICPTQEISTDSRCEYTQNNYQILKQSILQQPAETTSNTILIKSKEFYPQEGLVYFGFRMKGNVNMLYNYFQTEASFPMSPLVKLEIDVNQDLQQISIPFHLDIRQIQHHIQLISALEQEWSVLVICQQHLMNSWDQTSQFTPDSLLRSIQQTSVFAESLNIQIPFDLAQAIIISKIFEIAETIAPDPQCYIALNYSGSFTLMINGQVELQGYPVPDNQFRIYQSAERYTFQQGIYYYYIFYGFQLQIESFYFSECLDSNGDIMSVYPSIKSYAPMLQVTNKDEYESNLDNPVCSQDCYQCIDENNCLQCQNGMCLNEEGQCQEKPSYMIFYTGFEGMCEKKTRYFERLIKNVTFDQSAMILRLELTIFALDFNDQVGVFLMRDYHLIQDQKFNYVLGVYEQRKIAEGQVIEFTNVAFEEGSSFFEISLFYYDEYSNLGILYKTLEQDLSQNDLLEDTWLLGEFIMLESNKFHVLMFTVINSVNNDPITLSSLDCIGVIRFYYDFVEKGQLQCGSSSQNYDIPQPETLDFDLKDFLMLQVVFEPRTSYHFSPFFMLPSPIQIIDTLTICKPGLLWDLVLEECVSSCSENFMFITGNICSKKKNLPIGITCLTCTGDQIISSQDNIFQIYQNGQEFIAEDTSEIIINGGIGTVLNESSILIPANSFNSNASEFTFDLVIDQSQTYSIGSLTLAINYPPQQGQIQVSPPQGFWFNTTFNITATGFEDNNLPLSYFFSFKRLGEEEEEDIWEDFNNEEDKTVPYILAQFTLRKDTINPIQVKVIAQDGLGAQTIRFSNITLLELEPEQEDEEEESNEEDETETDEVPNIEELSNSVNQISGNITVKTEKLLAIQQTVNQLEASRTNSSNTTSPCPKCSGNGRCSSNNTVTCICKQGWTLVDCSVKDEDFNQIIEIKKQILDELEKLLEDENALKDPKVRSNTIQTIQKSSDSDFNTVDTIIQVQSLLNKALQIGERNSTKPSLTFNETSDAANVVNNMIQHSRQELCKSLDGDQVIENSTDRSEELKQAIYEDMEAYLELISENNFNNTANGESVTIENELFDVYNLKEGACDLVNNEEFIKATENSPEFQLKYKESNENLDCSETLQISFMVFNKDIYDCDTSINSGSFKSEVIFVIKNEDGEDITDEFKATLKYPEPVDCDDEGCDKVSDKICECNDMSLFDVGSQMRSLFQNSNLSSFKDLSSILNWKFYKDPIFYILVALVLSYICGLIAVNTKFKSYCALSKVRSSKIEPTKKQLIWTAVKGAQILWGINPYLIFLPLLLVQPILFIIDALVFPPKYLDKSVRKQKTSPGKVIGVILMVLILLGCLASIMIIASSNSEKDTLLWIFDFLFLIGQDVFLIPGFYLLIQLCVVGYYKNQQTKEGKNSKKKKKPLVQKILLNSDLMVLTLFKGKHRRIRRSIQRFKTSEIKVSQRAKIRGSKQSIPDNCEDITVKKQPGRN